MTGAYDALVVGAGPAGAAAAGHLAAAGARVLVVDRSTFPRDKTCGGGLTPRGVGAAERAGVDTTAPGFVRVDGIEMSGGGRTVSAAFPPTRSWPSHGVVARRSVLDQALLDAAIARGAEFRGGVRVLGPLMVDGRCVGARAQIDGSEVDLRAEVTVAADGATSAMARGAGLAEAAPSGRGFWYTALRAYFSGVEPRTGPSGANVLEFYPLRTASGRWLPAYGWVFPLPDGTANVGVDIPHRPRLRACPGLREAYDVFVADLRTTRPGFADAVESEPARGALLPESMRGFRPGTHGLIAVGDACGLITPYSGEGIAYALEGAEIAARSIVSASRASDVPDAYGERLRARFGFQFRTSLAIMKAMRRAPLARAAAAIGLRSDRAFRAAVRVMAYLIDEGPNGERSTVSTMYRAAERVSRIA